MTVHFHRNIYIEFYPVIPIWCLKGFKVLFEGWMWIACAAKPPPLPTPGKWPITSLFSLHLTELCGPVQMNCCANLCITSIYFIFLHERIYSELSLPVFAVNKSLRAQHNSFNFYCLLTLSDFLILWYFVKINSDVGIHTSWLQLFTVKPPN